MQQQCLHDHLHLVIACLYPPQSMLGQGQSFVTYANRISDQLSEFKTAAKEFADFAHALTAPQMIVAINEYEQTLDDQAPDTVKPFLLAYQDGDKNQTLQALEQSLTYNGIYIPHARSRHLDDLTFLLQVLYELRSTRPENHSQAGNTFAKQFILPGVENWLTAFKKAVKTPYYQNVANLLMLWVKTEKKIIQGQI